jgi:hypothetical protein
MLILFIHIYISVALYSSSPNRHNCKPTSLPSPWHRLPHAYNECLATGSGFPLWIIQWRRCSSILTIHFNKNKNKIVRVIKSMERIALQEVMYCRGSFLLATTYL